MFKRPLKTASLVAALAGTVLLGATATQAQPAYPTRPVTMIVPFAAGGPTDGLARLVAQAMSSDLGQQIVVENVGGAGGTVGSARAAKATPDGYTLLFGHAGTHAASVGLYKKLPYDPVNDYEHIGEAGDAPQILIVKKDLPVSNMKEFVDYVKANQDKMNFGTAGVGSASHLGGVMLNVALGTNVKAVNYRGAGPAMNDMLAGTLDYMIDVSTTALPQIQGGTVKPIAVMRTKRISALPDLPASPEGGVAGLDFSVWNVIMAPKGTPRPIVDRLNLALRNSLKDEKVRARLSELAIELPDEARLSPEGAKAHVKAEIEKWVPALKSAGVSLD
jgi:tripartite-type tricarboxylate transporter receptor subunit TctC